MIQTTKNVISSLCMLLAVGISKAVSRVKKGALSLDNCFMLLFQMVEFTMQGYLSTLKELIDNRP